MRKLITQKNNQNIIKNIDKEQNKVYNIIINKKRSFNYKQETEF